MNVIIVLIAASLTIAITFLIAFLWAVKNGQYDDNYTPAIRILFDETEVNSTQNTSGKAAREINDVR